MTPIDKEGVMPPLTRSTTAPDTVIERTAPFTLRAADGDGRTLDGYGAVFGQPTRIDSWEGKFDEVIQRGSFAKTLKERTPVIQFDHGRHPMIGSIPIAAPERIQEDSHGLHVLARMHEAELFEPVREAIASGAITGMSFRFQVVKEEWDESDELDAPLRTITEVKLFEVGPVVFPAYESTSVGVRSDLDRLLSDPETVARLTHLLGTREGAAPEGTPDGAADSDQEPLHAQHSGLSSDARARALALLLPKEGN